MPNIKDKHGLRWTRIYGIWCGMKNRCNSQKSKDYKNYGGRGIKVCKRWSSFKNFYSDMKNGYAENLTIDRINNNGNYEKKNCRWIPLAEQMKNKRNDGWKKRQRNNLGMFIKKAEELKAKAQELLEQAEKM